MSGNCLLVGGNPHYFLELMTGILAPHQGHFCCSVSLTTGQECNARSVMPSPGPGSKEYSRDEHPSCLGVFCVM